MEERLQAQPEMEAVTIPRLELKISIRKNNVHLRAVQTGRPAEEHLKSYKGYAQAGAGDSWQ